LFIEVTAHRFSRSLPSGPWEGARTAKRLHVSVPSHCVLLKSVADELTRRIAQIEIKTPKAIYVSNRRARAVRDPDGIRQDLATNIAHSVRWHDATTVAYERGIRFFIESPPGRTLTDLASAAFPDARSIALSHLPNPRQVIVAQWQSKL
jgi:malonate decarboxylase epsilon subunit